VSNDPAPLTAASPAERHRRIAGRFSDLVFGVSDWQALAPVDGWVARDVVDHLVTWFPGFLQAGSGIELPSGASVLDDPVGAWSVHSSAVQQLLDEPGSDQRTFGHQQTGAMPLPQAIDRFYTSDVFMHTWDLARASGQDDTLDEELCSAMFAGMEPMAEVLYASGQYGPRVPVPEGSDAQTSLLGLIGRDPLWLPPSQAGP
jgi:uncharacterized protein (TIGR03086 family)